jgi:alkanesulfonate monooxygenase SsuD/methylene tetrahydromethanopterin reductase-like flavin-dependent oxidoreductase (luciferase family)
MRFGINISSVFPKAKNLPLGLFADTAILSEELGYDGFFIPDHYNLPRSDECTEPYTTLAYIAAKTDKIRLGTTVTPLPRYYPPQLAKIIAHLDHLSKGRVIAGFGAGWHPPEFHTYAPQGWENPEVRVARMLEGTKLMVKLWTQERTTYKGKYYSVEDAVLEPKPLQKPHPPIWSGGSGEYMLRMTAKYFDGWIPTNWEWNNSGDTEARNYRKQVEKIKRYLTEYGRDESKFTFGVMGGITDSVEMIKAYRDIGCSYYIVFIGDYTPGRSYPFVFHSPQYLDLTRKFATEIMPSL